MRDGCKMGFLLRFCVAFMLVGCAGDLDPDTDNGRVIITNNTDREVLVYYAEEEEDYNDEVVIVQKKIELKPGETETIFIDTFLFDGEFSAVYGGIVKVYDVDFDLIGLEPSRVSIEIDDFENEVTDG